MLYSLVGPEQYRTIMDGSRSANLACRHISDPSPFVLHEKIPHQSRQSTVRQPDSPESTYFGTPPSRIGAVISRPDGDPRGIKSFWATLMRVTFPLLSQHVGVDMAEGWTLKHICVAMFNVPVSASEAFHGAQAQWITHRSPASTVGISSTASPLSAEPRYLGGT